MLGLSLLVSHPVWVIPAVAQGPVFGALRGTVKDEQGLLLPSVTLTATSSDGSRVQETTTDAAGYYSFTQLLPGEYEVTATLIGFSTAARAGVGIRTGMSVSLDLVMAVGGVSERVTVGTAPQLLESSSAAQTMNLAGNVARALPITGRRRLDDLLLAVPGVAFDEGTSSNFYSLNGSGISSHTLLIDGVEVKEPGAGSMRVQLSYEAIRDIQITSSGLEPSAPLGYGLFVNISTVAGENQVHASLSGLFQARSWTDNNQRGTTATNIAPGRRFGLLDGALGGPILASRAWYFSSMRFEDSSQIANLASSALDVFNAISPGVKAPRADYQNVSFMAKGTLAITSDHLTSAFVQRDRRSAATVASLIGAPDPAMHGGLTAAWRLSSVWSRQFGSQASVSYTSRATDLPQTDPSVPQRRIFGTVRPSGAQLVGVNLLGSIPHVREQAVERQEALTTVAFDVTWHPDVAILGRHDVNFGVYLSPRLTAIVDYQYANGGAAQEDYVLTDANDFRSPQRIFARKTYDSADVRVTDSTISDYAFYLGETWRPLERVTAKVGVRVDRVRQRDRLFARDVRSTTSVGPRLGMNVMLDRDGSTIARGSWGRIHQSPAETSVSLGITALGFRQEYDHDGDGQFETTLVTPGATQLNPNRLVDLERWDLPYVDESSVGLTRRIGARTSASIGYTRRAYRHNGTQIDVNGLYDESGRFVGYANESLNAINLVTNNIWNWPVAHAIDATWSGHLGRADVLVGYSRQWRALHGTWQPRDVAGILQPDAFPNRGGLAATNGIGPGSSYEELTFPSWRDHVGRVAFNWIAPWNVLASSLITVQSGVPSGPLLTVVPTPDLSYGPATVGLGNGRVVANPLATLTRFVGPTRDSGQVRLKTHTSWNLRVGRRFEFGRLQLDANVDVFNILNAAAPTLYAGGATTVGNPNYLRPAQLQAPRAGQLSVRVAF